jgi:hypothetical protein
MEEGEERFLVRDNRQVQYSVRWVAHWGKWRDGVWNKIEDRIKIEVGTRMEDGNKMEDGTN